MTKGKATHQYIGVACVLAHRSGPVLHFPWHRFPTLSKPKCSLLLLCPHLFLFTAGKIGAWPT